MKVLLDLHARLFHKVYLDKSQQKTTRHENIPTCSMQ